MHQQSETNSAPDFELLDFGALAAERELTLLPQVFLKTSKFDDLNSPNSKKVALLGNRGVGKSAVLAMLGKIAERDKAVVLRLSPEDYAYEYLTESLAKETAGAWAKQGAYTAAWKHLLYVSAMKAAIESQPGLKTGHSKRIYNFIRDNYSNASTNPIGTLVSYMKRLESIKIGKLEAGAKAKELQNLYSLEELNSLLDDLEVFCSKKPILILVDELDKGWDASEDAIAFVAGLFQAGAAISIRTPSVRVIMTLRRELFESIPSLNDDSQKLRDAVEMLDWNAKELLAMIAKRIKHSLQLNKDLPDTDAWHVVMPPLLWGYSSFDAILDFTLWRPRELIHICSQILDIARHSNRSLPFSFQDIEEAVNVYAKERCSDLVAEFRFQYPGLLSIIETFRNGPVSFEREDLELHCLRLSTGDLHVSEMAEWCTEKEPAELIEIFWKIGFLRANLNPTSTKTLFSSAFQVRFANINNSQNFKIHEAFSRYLDCHEQKNS